MWFPGNISRSFWIFEPYQWNMFIHPVFPRRQTTRRFWRREACFKQSFITYFGKMWNMPFFFSIFQLFRQTISESNKSASPLLWPPFQTEQQSKISLKYLLSWKWNVRNCSVNRFEFSKFVESNFVTKTLPKRFAARNKIVRGKLSYTHFQEITTRLCQLASLHCSYYIISNSLNVKVAHGLKKDVDDLLIQSWPLLSGTENYSVNHYLSKYPAIYAKIIVNVSNKTTLK